MRTVKWLGTSQKDIREFPEEARKQLGLEIMAVQYDMEPSDWKPMSSVGRGVREIRVKVDNQYRVIYVTKKKDTVHVLHAFVKKTQKN